MPRIAICMEYPLAQTGGVEVLVCEFVRGLSRDFDIVLVSDDSPQSVNDAGFADLIVAHLPWKFGSGTPDRMEALVAQLKALDVRLAHLCSRTDPCLRMIYFVNSLQSGCAKHLPAAIKPAISIYEGVHFEDYRLKSFQGVQPCFKQLELSTFHIENEDIERAMLLNGIPERKRTDFKPYPANVPGGTPDHELRMGMEREITWFGSGCSVEKAERAVVDGHIFGNGRNEQRVAFNHDMPGAFFEPLVRGAGDDPETASVFQDTICRPQIFCNQAPFLILVIVEKKACTEVSIGQIPGDFEFASISAVAANN